jgi:hypothetical protein
VGDVLCPFCHKQLCPSGSGQTAYLLATHLAGFHADDWRDLLTQAMRVLAPRIAAKLIALGEET